MAKEKEGLIDFILVWIKKIKIFEDPFKSNIFEPNSFD